jgi:hypothetical protein
MRANARELADGRNPFGRDFPALPAHYRGFIDGKDTAELFQGQALGFAEGSERV